MLPNYNHAPFLNERLESIVNQGVDDLEILLMDDFSQDVSPQILQDFCRRDRRARLLANTTNSGSTFRQWKKGLAEARGEFVWIAESDDAADPELLRSLLALHEAHPETILCYAQSLMMDLSSRPYGPATSWTDDIDPERWKQDYVAPGLEELAVALSVKNTIPNVSAVLFRNRAVLREVIDENMRLCADWLSYVRLCGHGEIGYCHRPLNRWRLASSNARTKPPGETEWVEGARIYDEIGRLLRWTAEELQQRREALRRKCEAWKEAA
jgi:glycosyltransferase involved in cell wall biosynthesis